MTARGRRDGVDMSELVTRWSWWAEETEGAVVGTATVMDDPHTRAAGAATRSRIDEVREFGRFWVRDVVSRLDDGLSGSTYSPAEARVIFDLGASGRTELGWLRVCCGIDAGHLVRILQRLRNEGLVATTPVPGPGGPAVELTGRGREVLALLDQQVAEHAGSILAGLREDRQRDVVAAMAMIRRALSGQSGHPFVLRAPGPGDLGWVVQRHGTVFAEEYGWDERYEGEVAELVAGFAASRDPSRERAWIAEVDAAPAGCLFCLRAGRDPGSAARSGDGDEHRGAGVGPPVPAAGGVGGAAGTDGADSTWTADGAVSPLPPEDARLSLLLVDPAARGLGVGRRLVAEGVAFARRAGYARLLLRTEDLFVSARRIVEAAGFRLAQEYPHRRYGRVVQGQEWVLDLARDPRT